MPPRTRSRSATRAGGARSPRRPEKAAPAPAAPPAPAPPEPPGPEPIAVTQPELLFAARAGVAEPPRPLPAMRRSVFIDVENASRPEHVARVLDHLGLDWTDRRTDLVAVGNWRVISPDTARLLAHRGAQLVHSAPSTGVRDWSDLRIAVAAGVWLAAARPGDRIEIVSNDQAFDAIGDVAASLGVVFRRLSIHELDGGHAAAPPDRAPAGRRPSRRGRRGRGSRGGPRKPHVAAVERPHTIHRAPRVEPPAEAVPPPDLHPHPAPAEEIRKTVEGLLATSPQGVTLDALSRALKAHGFRRPPGSLRLITRLRHLKGIEVTRTGLVRLVAPHPADATAEPEASGEGDQPVADSAAPEAPGHPPRGASRRRGRRGGRRRRRPASESSAGAAAVSQDAPESAAEAPSG